jgi:hypothetical protein
VSKRLEWTLRISAAILIVVFFLLVCFSTDRQQPSPFIDAMPDAVIDAVPDVIPGIAETLPGMIEAVSEEQKPPAAGHYETRHQCGPEGCAPAARPSRLFNRR